MDTMMTDVAFPAGAQHASTNAMLPHRQNKTVSGVSTFKYTVPANLQELMELRVIAHDVLTT